MTEKMWKFLFAIYGGGPIIKQKKKTPSQNLSQGPQTQTYDMTPDRNPGELVEEYNLDNEEQKMKL